MIDIGDEEMHSFFTRARKAPMKKTKPSTPQPTDSFIRALCKDKFFSGEGGSEMWECIGAIKKDLDVAGAFHQMACRCQGLELMVRWLERRLARLEGKKRGKSTRS